VITYGSSFQGRRKNNQDRFLISEPAEEVTFLAVADGIGGMVGGDIASKLVIDTAKEIIEKSFKNTVVQTDLKQVLLKIYSEGQRAIKSRILLESSLENMGTTMCCLLIHKDDYVWANIGDSRIYHFSNSNFYKITEDHTTLEEHMAFGNEKVTVDIINNYGHLLTRSLNGGSDQPDIYPKDIPCMKLKKSEGFLLCSDGLLLNKYGDENPIFKKYFKSSDNLREFTKNIISNAYSNGSQDNITCITAWND